MKKLVCVMLALVAALGAVSCGEPKFEEVWIEREPEYGIINQVCVSADGVNTYFTGRIGLKQVGKREYEIWAYNGYDGDINREVKAVAHIILTEGGMISIYRYWKLFDYATFVVTDTPNADVYAG